MFLIISQLDLELNYFSMVTCLSYANDFIMFLSNECCVSEIFNIVFIAKYWVCLLFSLVREILKNLPEEMFHADIKEKKYVSNILKSVPRGGEIDIVYNETISRFVNLTCKKTFFSLINVWKKKTTHFLNAFHLRQDSSVDIIESRNSSVCCIEFIKWTVRNIITQTTLVPRVISAGAVSSIERKLLSMTGYQGYQLQWSRNH